MKIAKIISWFGLLAMVAILLNGFIHGSFSEDGAELLANPWGLVSLVDLYVGFAFFSMWIAFREKNVLSAVIWIILTILFGFLTAAIYILLALYQNDGDWLGLFLGARKSILLREAK